MSISVASVVHDHQGQGEVSHAMVLDTFDANNDMLIFKNTYDDPVCGQPKQFKIRRCDRNAPKELYFVHIEIKDIDSLPGQEEREAVWKAKWDRKRKTNVELKIIGNQRTNQIENFCSLLI